MVHESADMTAHSALLEAPVEAGDEPPLATLFEVVIPVHNDQVAIGPCVHRLRRHLADNLRQPFRITLADRGSTDDTVAVATDLAGLFADVSVVSLLDTLRSEERSQTSNALYSRVTVLLDIRSPYALEALMPVVARK